MREREREMCENMRLPHVIRLSRTLIDFFVVTIVLALRSERAWTTPRRLLRDLVVVVLFTR